MTTTQDQTAAKIPKRVIWLAVAGAVGGFLFGFDSSVVNGAVDAIKDEFALSEAVTGFAVAVALLGCAAGAYLAGKIADRYGRIPAMKLGALLFLVSAIGTGFAFGVWDLIFWRLVGGLGIGLASVIAPAYISEISPRHVRGRLASLQQLAITTGIFAALLSDAVFATSAGGADQALWFGLEAWRWMFMAAAVPAVVYGWIAFTLPESPRFLVFQGKDEEALKVFTSIAPDEDSDRHLRDIKKAIDEDKLAGQKGSLRGKALGLQPVVWIGIILSVLQQFVGINVIFYYSTTLWKAVGFQEKDSLTISVATAITNILVTLVAIALVDRIGRRPIMLAGSIGMALSLGTMALAFGSATGSGDAISLPGGVGSGRAGRRQRLRHQLRRLLGPAGVGAAGRDLPVPDPRPRPGPGRGRTVDRQLRHHPELPRHGRGLAAADVRHVRAVRGGVVLLRDVQGAGDQRHVPGAGRNPVRPEGFRQGSPPRLREGVRQGLSRRL